MCPHFHILHEIFGSEASSRLPFQFSKSGISINDDNDQHYDAGRSDAYMDESNDNNSDFSDAQHNDNDSVQSIQNSHYEPRSRRKSQSHRQRNMSFHNVLIPELEMHEIPQIKSEFKRHKPNEESRTNGIDNSDLVNEFRNEMENYAAQQQQQNRSDEERHRKIELLNQRFELEKVCRLRELELKKYEIDSNEKVRILQLEKEERMERLKLELDFKVQMGKLRETS